MEEGGALGRQRAKQVSPFCAMGTVGISGVQNCRAVAQAEWVIVLGREELEIHWKFQITLPVCYVQNQPGATALL